MNVNPPVEVSVSRRGFAVDKVTLKLARFESAFTRKFNRSPGLDFGLQLDDAGYITGIDVDSVIDSDNEVI